MVYAYNMYSHAYITTNIGFTDKTIGTTDAL